MQATHPSFRGDGVSKFTSYRFVFSNSAQGGISVKLKTLISMLAVSSLMATAAGAANISGAGSTFAYPIFAKWADAYKKENGNGLNYQSIGSGGGIQQIKAKTVIFGASDMPLEVKDLDGAGLIQFPAIIGGVVPVVNIPGVKPGEMVLDGPTLARIYMGEIKKWDDVAIKNLNPDVKLPSTAIAVVERSDGSGTTFIFTNYLSKVSPDWASKVGFNTAVQWPVGLGAKGNEGVAGQSSQMQGSIGYIEYAYAKQNNMTYVRMMNKAGKAVSPTAASFQAGAANADWTGTPGFVVVLTDQAGDAAWPIEGATFVIVYKQPSDPAATAEALKFFAWSFKNGGKMAEELDYVPVPDKVVGAIHKIWTDNVKDGSGKAVYSN
jgi:phosphate transport system substrate-binding protein